MIDLVDFSISDLLIAAKHWRGALPVSLCKGVVYLCRQLLKPMSGFVTARGPASMENPLLCELFGRIEAFEEAHFDVKPQPHIMAIDQIADFLVQALERSQLLIELVEDCAVSA